MRFVRFIIFTAVIALSSCSLIPTESSTKVRNPEAEALRSVPFQVNIAPLNLDKFKNPDYRIAQTQSGDYVVALSPKQFTRTIELLTRLREHIRLQRKALDEIKAYYEQSSGGQKVDKHNRSAD